MPVLVGAQTDRDEQVRRIAAQLRCPVCQNLSVADSPSELAQEMRGVIREQLEAGRSPEEITAYFLEKYGDWILLSPRPRGLSLLLWLAPFAAAAVGLVIAGLAIRRWTRRPARSALPSPDPALIERVRREALNDGGLAEPDGGPLASPLGAEQGRLYAALRELDFDHRAGKLSAEDYAAMRQDYEGRAVAVLATLETAARVAAPGPVSASAGEAPSKPERPGGLVTRTRRWRLAAGGAFLLVFGVALGVGLTRSLRPRMGEQDTITGDFLTGTGPGGIAPGSRAPGRDLGAALASGRSAYERRDWKAAIESFRQAVALDPDNPEAHTFLGIILLHAGHGGEALLAIDRALKRDPGYAFALWAKGLVLFEAKQDYAGAVRVWEPLMGQKLAAADAEQVVRMLAEARTRLAAQVSGPAARTESGSRITGTVSLPPSPGARPPAGGVLFIIARKGDGPPLAVKRVSDPTFPLAFTLGPEDVMLRGAPLEGNVTLVARLKQDGAAGPAVVGDLEGMVKAPVSVGQSGVQLVLDHVR
jgi:cytochrome c-type biogenesis protein CcmH